MSAPLSSSAARAQGRLAAPSWVWPGTPAANCARLTGHFPEVGLCLFELQACLDYAPDDLPATPDGLDFHAHLPLDLDWAAGPEAVAAGLLRLTGRIGHLAPRHFVLHPPQDPAALEAAAALLIRDGLAPASILVENIEGNDLHACLPVIRDLGLGLCLDLGHLLAYGQEDLLEDLDAAGLYGRVGMLHLCLAGPDGRHLPLTGLDAPENATGRAMLARLLDACPEATLMLELFKPGDLFASKDWLLDFVARP